MEEILASIRRIIADDDTGRALAKESAAKEDHSRPTEPAAATRPVPAPSKAPPPLTSPPPGAAPPDSAAQDEEIDSMLAQLQASASRQPADPVSEAGSDILDLTEQMASETPPASAFRTIDGHPDIVFEESPPDPPPVPAVRVEPPPRRTTVDTSGLMSAAATAAVDSAFNTLAQTVLVQNARTLEDLVREMLRPMLKSWLDDNLPSLVERLVRAEIERVSRGRG
jgi:uncharacterized protein